MTAKDLILKGKVAVRTSGTLYPIYQNLFKEAFGFIPECPTCGSVNGHKHWEAFVAFGNGADPNTLLIQNNKTMANTNTKKTFEVKNKSIIYSYNFKKKGLDREFTARTYGDVMTEDFALAYLDSAAEDKELLNKRKAEFSVLPSKYAKKEDTTNTSKAGSEDGKDVDLSKLKLVDLQAIATEKQYPAEEWEKIKSKADLIAYLDAKAIPVTGASDTGKAGSEDGAPEPLKTEKPEEGADKNDDLS